MRVEGQPPSKRRPATSTRTTHTTRPYDPSRGARGGSAEPVTDADTLAQVTRAYATKYAGSPFVRPLLGGPSVEATLRLNPA